MCKRPDRFVLYREKDSPISDSGEWTPSFLGLLFSLSFVVWLSFPQIAAVVSQALGFQAASNFVFLYVVAVLVVRDFSTTVKYARLRDRLTSLIQEIALRDVD
ncbi:MAG: DUF2304 domain-containing protein [Collinsella sp.]